MKTHKIVIVTGELSGEMHAAELVRAMKKSIAAEISGIGSQRLQDSGVEIIYDYRKISLTGLSEIFSKLRYIKEAYRRLKKHIEDTRPSLIILVDFPGFNLKIARFAKKLGIPVVYFIPPQVWAWRKKRILQIRECIDRVICILPFEKKLYREYGIDAEYVGHPFTSTVKPTSTKEDFFRKAGIKEGSTVITIMPGSRENEIIRHMPILLASIEKIRSRIKHLSVVLPLADNVDEAVIKRFEASLKNCIIIRGQSHDALAHCHLVIVASGSATLEAAILGTPAIVIYRISRFSYLIARMLVKVNYISLPNLIAGKEVFPEFIQHIVPEKIAEKAIDMINNGKDGIKKDTNEILMQLGHYDSYEIAKNIIVEFLEKQYGTISKTA